VERADGRLADGGPAALRRRAEQIRLDLNLMNQLARIRLEVALKADPSYRDAFRAYGLDVEALDPDEAAQLIRASVVKEELVLGLDNWVRARRLKGIVMGEPPGWQRLLAIARKADPDPWRDQLREALLREDRTTLANLARDPAVMARPPASVFLLANVLDMTSEVRLAAKVLRQVQARHPNDPWINLSLGGYLKKLGQPVDALRFFTAFLAILPQYAGAHHIVGEALAELGARDEAIAAFKEAIRLEPNYVDAHIQLGNALTDKGAADEAIAAYNEAIRLKPGEALAHFNLARSLTQKGALDKAIAACQKAIDLKPGWAEAYHNLGLALKAKGALDDAVTAYKKAIDRKPEFAEAHLSLGSALSGKGALDDAMAAYNEAIRLKPDFALAYYNLGSALRDKGRLDDAIAVCKKAIGLKPDFVEAHINLGINFGKKGALDDAVAAFRKAIEFKPHHANAHRNLGHALMRKGDWQGAIAASKKAIDYGVKDAGTYNDLGIGLAETGALDEAITAWQEAIRLQPDDAEVLGNLGHALELKGKFAEALTTLRRGRELASKNPRLLNQFNRWIQECERLVDLDGRLPAVLRGESVPASASERLEFAGLCNRKHLNVAGARFYQEAFAERPELAEDMPKGHRYNAACLAALAGCARGDDAAGLDADQRAGWRRQALEWLRADLAHWAKQVASPSPQARLAVQKRLQHWQRDRDLSGLRGEAALAALPEPERNAWGTVWADVENTLAQVRGKRASKAGPQP
jgi:superkiller protein 3